MNENEIVKSLSETRNPRTTIYLNQERIDDFYSQTVGAITELARKGKIGSKISAGILGILGSEVNADKELAGNMKMTPVLKAILIETQARDSGQLIDLAADQARPMTLLRYIGESQIVYMWDEVNPGNARIAENDARTLQIERTRQERFLRFTNDKVGTIVWVASVNGRTVGSIAVSDRINMNELGSAPPSRGRFGIIGAYENEIDGVVLISPFWIWQDK